MRCGQRSALLACCSLAIAGLLRLELRAELPAHTAPTGTVPSPFAAVLPCTVKDGQWLVAKIMSCAQTLSEGNMRSVLIVLPRRDVKPMHKVLRSASVSLPAHWHLVPEDEVLPKLWAEPPHRPRIPGWNLQQALKLLARHHPLISRASPPIEYVLTVDSDVVCTPGWGAHDGQDDRPPRGAGPAGAPQQSDGGVAGAQPPWALARSAGARGTPLRESAFSRAFLAEGGRVLTCLERLSGWFGQRHLAMTARSFGFADWLTEGGRVRSELFGAHVMGWTPQILSVAALDAVEAELVRRVRLPAEPADELRAAAAFRRLANSTHWTEYFTYYLALDGLGLWGAFHTSLCAARGSRIEPSSGRCEAELRPLGGADDPGGIVAALRALNGTRSSSVGGCLKVRIDCVQELLLELNHALVPFLTVNDHNLRAEQVVHALRATLGAPPRSASLESLKAPASRCCSSPHVVWQPEGLGPLPRPTLRVLDRACG